MREGEAVKAGQVIVRFDTADLEARLTDRMGALEASRAQLALAEKTRTQNQLLLKQKFISQNAYDSAESNLSVSPGHAQVQRGAGGAGPDRAELRGGRPRRCPARSPSATSSPGRR